MLELKKLTPGGVSTALSLANRYRLLNDPQAAESICLDILEIEPQNTEALKTLLLALTDNFMHGINPSFTKAEKVLHRFEDAFMRSYYEGIICERRGKAHLRIGGPNSSEMVVTWLKKATDAFQKAIEADPDREEAIIRWNSCARLINDQNLPKGSEEREQEGLLDSYETPH